MNEQLEFKANVGVDEAGTITGIAQPFGIADAVGDIIRKGAFNVAASDLPMVFGHNVEDVIGLWHEVKESDILGDHGLAAFSHGLDPNWTCGLS